MCGIVGYISDNDQLYTEAKNHFMKYALTLDTLRGKDSTGIITVKNRFSTKLLKTTMAGDAFVHTKEYEKKFKLGWAQIGHNRAATRGKVNVENAHPFRFGTVCMVHNGTLYDDGHSLDTFDPKIGSVDSMQIAYALSKMEPEDAHKVFTSLSGSYAVVWTDARDESINMARNSQRPLHFTYNKQKSILWYMSDGHHLHSINKSFGKDQCSGSSVYELDCGKVFKFKKGNMVPEVTTVAPFVFQKTEKTATKRGGSDSTPANRRAAETWNRKLESSTTQKQNSGGTSDIRLMIEGKLRKIPKCMVRALDLELFLKPEDLFKFTPQCSTLMKNKRYSVHGVINIEMWGDTEWPMTIYDVPAVQYKAYRKDDWLVRAIGITHPHEFSKTKPAALGYLVHTDWKGFESKRKKILEQQSSEDDKEEDSTPEHDTLVAGPDGQMVAWGKLAVMLESGCIGCGLDLMNEDLSDCLAVNEGRDILCPECVEDLTDPYKDGQLIN